MKYCNDCYWHDPVRKITKYVLAITALIFIWYIIADRHAPWSDQARVQTYVIPIVPQVSGRVIEVLVKQDQMPPERHTF